MANQKTDLVGSKVSITAEVIEHLTYGKKQWITIRLPNNQKVTLNLAECQLVSQEEP
jgi:hypothetical protein